MQLSLVSRTRARIAIPIARAVVRTPWLCRFVGRSRSAPVNGRTLDPQLAAMLGLDDIDGGSELAELSPDQARAQMAQGILVAQDPFEGDLAVETIKVAGGTGPISARTYTPRGLASRSPGILYLHGGGFVICDLDTHDPFCRLLATHARARVISIDYRLGPEHRYPAAADDATAAYRDIAARARSLGLDPSRIAIVGDSAGGHLSAVVARRTLGDAVHPALHVPIYPALDSTCSLPSHTAYAKRYLLTRRTIDWYYAGYFGDDHAVRRTPDASPLLASDFRGLPPTLVYTSGFDPLLDEGVAYAARLKDAGVPVRHLCFDNMLHGFLLMTGLSDAARAATVRVATEIGEALRPGGLAG
jgi:acetyl esterase